MADVKSYAWALQLPVVVGSGGTVEIVTLGFNDPAQYDTANTGVVYGATVLREDQVTTAWAEDFSSVTLTNTDPELIWYPPDAIHVTVSRIPFNTADIEASFNALEARVSASETAITDLETRTVANETAITDLETRVTALETPVGTRSAEEDPEPEEPEHGKAHKPGHVRAPQHRGSGTKA